MEYTGVEEGGLTGLPAVRHGWNFSIKKALRKTGGFIIIYVLTGQIINGLFQSSLVANGKLVAAFCTTACQHFAAIGAFHALTKAMYAFAATIMWLECTFHN